MASDKSKFATRAVLLFAVAMICIVALNVLEKHDLIDRKTEGLLRLVFIGGLSVALIISVMRTSLALPLRIALLLTVTAGSPPKGCED